jgi:tetratricopeptide (TPR) repeat protein
MRVTAFIQGASLMCVVAACGRTTQAPVDSTAGHAATTASSVSRTEPLEELGRYHREIRTSVPLAQTFFDEGLTLLYGFNHDEAFRSFQRAAALDTLSPMPHWGMALALGTNINDPAPADRIAKAATHLADAVRRAAAGSAVEQGLVAALARRYAVDSTVEQSVREQAYSDAMGSLAKAHPGDADVSTLYAESMMNLHPWRLYRPDGTPESWTPAIVATLERVLTAQPTHPGANHYYVHAVEASKTPERATPSATRLETLVPGAGHLVHMPSHIYIRTGQYAKAARSNEIAAGVDERYLSRTGTDNFYAMAYFSHNLQFEAAAAMFSGNRAEAMRAAKRTATLTHPMAAGMAMLEPFAAMELLVQARYGDWPAILATSPPPAQRVLQTGLYRWARGVAFANTQRTAEAAVELDSLTRVQSRVPKEAMVGPVNWGGDVLLVAIADLQGYIAQAHGDLPGAIEAFTRAVRAEDRLGYNEPPDWLFPERERLGVVLLVAGKASQAAATFRAELDAHPGNPRAMFGLWQSLVASRDAGAAAMRARFDEAWKDADVALGQDLFPAR